MKKGTPFFGRETTNRDEAFPGIKSISLLVEQDLYGFHSRDGKIVQHRYSKASMPRYETCVNRSCKQGGLDLQMLVMFPPAHGTLYNCSGHEGSPQGRRKGRDCDNSFRITLTLEKDSDKHADST